uniref:Reverse transcriptase domain-containing protein n=1 Tax=Tanacetum cinerariifolium TaxID=118510 RepID=A0A6L2JV21_TANCI|nr:reverse transcriptase domain-containing protein [Tanacetum cinerariifolium]
MVVWEVYGFTCCESRLSPPGWSCGGPFFGDLQWRLASLPIRFGGFGLYSAKLVSSYAFVASRAQSWVLQDHILRNSGMDDDYVSALACLHDMIPSFDFSGFNNKDTKAVFESLRAPHAHDFLLAIPIDGLDQYMRVGISAKKETLVNFITDPSDGRSTLRSADVLVFGLVEGKHACVDLSGVSLLVGLSSRGFTTGQPALKGALCKVTKHDKACIENQHVFIPFAFDTFGFFAPEAVELLSRVQWVMHNNVMTPRSKDVVFKRIGFSIQKRLAAQLVAHLPSTTISAIRGTATISPVQTKPSNHQNKLSTFPAWQAAMPTTTTMFAATTPENTPLGYLASTSTNHNPVFSPAFAKANYETLDEDYDEEREMVPRTEPARAVTPPLRAASPRVRRRRKRVVGFEESQNRGESKVERNSEGGRPSEKAPRGNGSQNVNLPPLLAAHVGRSENGQPLHSSLTSAYGGQALSNNIGGNLPPNGLFPNPLGSVTPFIRWIEDYPLPDGLKIPSHIGSYDGKGDPNNFLHLFDSTRICWNSQKAGSILDYEDLKAKFRSHFSQQEKFTKTHMAVHNIKQRENKSTRAFITRYTDDTLLILGSHEDQRIFGFIHGLRTRSLVEHLSTDLPPTYKGLIEKTYTWVEAREVATNSVLNDQRDSFERPKKSSWNNNKGQMGRSRSFPYERESYQLLSNLAKIPREIFATERVSKTFEHPLRLLGPNWPNDKTRYCHFHEEYGHETNKFRRKEERRKASIRKNPYLYGKRKRPQAEEETGERQRDKRNYVSPIPNEGSSDPVVIKVYISRRQVNMAYLDSRSSCEVIYEHCFLKLKPLIRSLRVDSNTPFVGFLGEESRPLGEIPLEVTIEEGPLTITKTLTFVIVRLDSPHNILLGRTAMQEMGIVESTVHGAIKFTRLMALVPYSQNTTHRGQWKKKETQPITVRKRTKKKQHSSHEKEFLLQKATLQFKNAGATYQRLIDKVFGSQIRRNMEVNADDMVIKSDSEEEMLDDIKETFERLRAINLKLNPKKCSFGVEEGIYFGHLVMKQGIRADPSKQVLAKQEKSGCVAKWAIELGDDEIEFKGRNSIKGASSSDGSRAGLMLVNPEAKEYMYTLRFKFETTNNEAEYEALIAGLHIAKEMHIQELAIFVDSQLVANQVKGLFEARQQTIKQYLEKIMGLLSSFPNYSIKHIKTKQNKKADAFSKLSLMTFSKLAKEVLIEVIQTKSVAEKEITNIVKEDEDSWMVPIREYLKEGILPKDPQKARKLGIKASLYRMIEERLYRRSYMSPWLRSPTNSAGGARRRVFCKKLGALQAFTFVYHPQANGQVEMTNREIVKGMKRRLGMAHQAWVDKLLQVLWAHKTTPKSSNGETPFSLVYESEAVIHIEIRWKQSESKTLIPRKMKKDAEKTLTSLKKEGKWQ